MAKNISILFIRVTLLPVRVPKTVIQKILCEREEKEKIKLEIFINNIEHIIKSFKNIISFVIKFLIIKRKIPPILYSD